MNLANLVRSKFGVYAICQCAGFAVKLLGHTLHGLAPTVFTLRFLDFAQASMWGAVDFMPASKAREIVMGSLIDLMSIVQIHDIYETMILNII